MALYRHAHWSIQHISDVLSISKSSVYRIALQSEHCDPQTPPKPTGRRVVCTTRKRRRLVNRLSTDAFHRRLRFDQLSQLENLEFDIRTLRKALAKEGYKRHLARKKPWLSEAHKEARLQWAQEHLNWSDRQWTSVLWTDEASVRCGYFGQIYVTRTKDEALNKDCLTTRYRKYSACMIWACIGSDGIKSSFVFDKGKVNGDVYRSKIVPLIVQAVRQHRADSVFQQEPLVMQDNASIHNAHETIALFNDLNVRLMSWPANSPDLNPIENVWCLLKHRIGRHLPKNRAEVIAAIQFEWGRLTSSDVSRCCQSMRQRCQAVIDAKGGHTKW